MRVSIALLLVSLSLLSLLPSSLSQTLTVVSSIQATKDRLTVQPPVNFSQTQPRGDVLTLFPSIQFQNILGFGGALTEAAATTWLKLPAALQAEVLRAYYNSSEGHRYRWGRVPIGSCDFTDFSYNFDNVTDDFDLKAFDTNATQDRQTIIPLIKAIQAIAYTHMHTHTPPHTRRSSTSSQHPPLMAMDDRLSAPLVVHQSPRPTSPRGRASHVLPDPHPASPYASFSSSSVAVS